VLSGFPFMPQATTSASLEEFRRMFDPVTGAVFNAPFLAALTERVDGGWRRNPAAADLGASQELLDFLRRAQDIADAFFPEGNLQLFYVLRPVLANDEQIIELSIDGRSESWRRGETVQQLFAWPDPTNPGVQGAAGSDTNKFTFYSDNGAWAAFRFFADAAGRRPGDRLVEWNQIGGQPLNPPVQLQIVEFPGDVDVFHPSFLGGLTCPRSATD
jgi:type VI protein secretion system component VasK